MARTKGQREEYRRLHRNNRIKYRTVKMHINELKQKRAARKLHKRKPSENLPPEKRFLGKKSA